MAGVFLPFPFQRPLEEYLQRLLTPAGGGTFNFSSPRGSAALLSPNSIAWRVFSNPVTLFIGGVAAVLLELAEPRVRHGVWDHSSFRRNPLERLQRTGHAAMVSVYGPANAARSMIGQIRSIHREIRGVTSSGELYRADDPQLLGWVHSTASFGFMEAYRSFGGRISSEELDSYYAEVAPIATLYGALTPPCSERERKEEFGRMHPKLEPSSAIFEFLDIMEKVPALPRVTRTAQRLLVAAAVDLLPSGTAAKLRLNQRILRQWERPLVAVMAAAGSRLVLRTSPAVQSCRRLGLPDDWLYSR